jgi:type IV fimbrial biogenesis protein FimT
MVVARAAAPRHGAGFTMPELMAVVAILAILASVAAPSLTDMVNAQQLRSGSSELHAALMRARSEAVKRNREVTLAPVTANSWQSGWTIADPNTANTSLEVHAALKDVTVTGPANIIYQPNGRLKGSDVPQFELTSPKGSKRCIDVDLSGRPYLKPSACTS